MLFIEPSPLLSMEEIPELIEAMSESSLSRSPVFEGSMSIGVRERK
ncbi:hypothetical protein OIU79_012149, partial [Salix purpurea]